jgi:hypothetical protein
MTNTKEISMIWPRSSTRPASHQRRSWRPNLEQVEGRQLLTSTLLHVLGTDHNLWHEAAGWQQSGQVWAGGNVGTSAIADTLASLHTLIANPAAASDYFLAPATAPLYNQGGPSYLDVEQGQVGDCWLLSSLAEVAARYPKDIENMFTYDGTAVENGSIVRLYTVRLFGRDGAEHGIEVDTELPSGGQYYAHVANALGTEALWVALAEKAYAEAGSLGWVTTSHGASDSYNELEAGDPAWALQAITGKPASDYLINPTNIAAAWSAGDLVVLCSGIPSSPYIVAGHCYAVVGYNASSTRPFEVFNPWGTDSGGWAPGETDRYYGRFTASAAFLWQNFFEQSFGMGAMEGDIITGTVEDRTGLAALGIDPDPSGRIPSAPHRSTGSPTTPRSFWTIEETRP